jgi:hypothetical protein
MTSRDQREVSHRSWRARDDTDARRPTSRSQHVASRPNARSRIDRIDASKNAFLSKPARGLASIATPDPRSNTSRTRLTRLDSGSRPPRGLASIVTSHVDTVHGSRPTRGLASIAPPIEAGSGHQRASRPARGLASTATRSDSSHVETNARSRIDYRALVLSQTFRPFNSSRPSRGLASIATTLGRTAEGRDQREVSHRLLRASMPPCAICHVRPLTAEMKNDRVRKSRPARGLASTTTAPSRLTPHTAESSRPPRGLASIATVPHLPRQEGLLGRRDHREVSHRLLHLGTTFGLLLCRVVETTARSRSDCYIDTAHLVGTVGMNLDVETSARSRSDCFEYGTDVAVETNARSRIDWRAANDCRDQREVSHRLLRFPRTR